MAGNENEAGLRDFLISSWGSFDTPGAVSLTRQLDGALVGNFKQGRWTLVDTYYVNPLSTLYSGREVVFRDGTAIWAASYHTAIPDEQLQNAVDGFYADKVAPHPNPDFPVVSVDGIEDDTFREHHESLMPGVLTLAHFAVASTITHKPSNQVALLDHTIGGWLS
ncbi:MAG: hypothetical protein JWM81_1173 [Candidatus Saccharibacteria bacterium]|nr:hypothetical protein [Candidatus Saccharibacteria bacterium]